jgi:alpha-L-fucosidase
VWRGPEFLSWLYNESPVRDTVVANDRWGRGFRGKCGDHYTTEYEDVAHDGEASDTHPWEECRGIGNSFGYSKFETPKDYMSRERCVETLVNCVSRGGNLLLNVGPTADGRIPAIMQDRLLAIGRWLDVNGEAIYASAKWDEAPKGLKGVYFTRKANDLYLISFAPGRTPITAKTGEVKSVAVLGAPAVKVEWSVKDGVLTVVPPAFAAGECPCEFAPVLKIAR